jgi:lysophospholipase
MLEGAGVIQGFDSRDSDVGTSGLYQALTYMAGLSGGAFLLGSVAGNNYPTITSLKENVWTGALIDTILLPDGLLSIIADPRIALDIQAKDNAGFDPTLTDPWGRLISYQILQGDDGGVSTRFSSVTGFSSFAQFNAPFPIITSLGVPPGSCLPPLSATQYEFSPYEFGSWDAGVNAFTQTKYLGTNLSNGVPAAANVCTQNYDNLGYMVGTSSSLFSELCASSLSTASIANNSLTSALNPLLPSSHSRTDRDLYAAYPNPFKNYAPATSVSNQDELMLVDGGSALQNNPIWPFIQSTSRVDVLIVNDNSADTTDNYPNGTEILTTYQQAQAKGLSRMPFIPDVSVFVSQGLNKRATFFGCNDATKLTIVFLPNTNYTTDSGVPTAKIQYSSSETDAMVANGVQIATQNGDAGWPTCLGCALVMKTGTTLPAECGACFTKYCFNG